MKLRYAVLIALAVTLSAGLAKADPVDPTVIINRLGDPPCMTTPPPGVTCFDQTNSSSNPLVLNLVNGFLPLTTFIYDGTSPLTTLYLAFTGALPFEQFTCTSDIFTSCGFIATQGTNFSNDVEFFFTGGILNRGDAITVVTPEPGLMLQLLIGIGPLFLFGRKYWVTAEAD